MAQSSWATKGFALENVRNTHATDFTLYHGRENSIVHDGFFSKKTH